MPFVAAEGVDAVIRRDDEVKEKIIRPMFGDEWPRERTFPNQTVTDGETLVSAPTARWRSRETSRTSTCTATSADGFWKPWLANIARLRAELATDAEVHFGHVKRRRRRSSSA